MGHKRTEKISRGSGIFYDWSQLSGISFRSVKKRDVIKS